MSRYVVTGAKGGQTQGADAPNRLEINDFVKNDAHFSLYVQALQSLYSRKSQSQVDSFFQIAGIHGLPYVSWDGSGGQAADPNGWRGYCMHGDVLFPTFHRPYMILIEQAIQAEAVRIAATYTVDAQRFKDAAQNLRQPYWDWARNSVPPAEVISLNQVTITGPDGRKVAVTNPLRRYTFNPIDPSFPRPYSGWKTTLRNPTSLSANATEDISGMQRTLQRVQSQVRAATYSMLTRVRTWPAFSNHTVGDGGSSSNSLEAIHDSIHAYVGGRGHMNDPSVAAFDPIFFMHHAQVDRLLSLWSALHPGVWVSPSTSEDGTWTLPVDTPIDQNTQLAPFWNTQSTYWTSSNITSTAPLGFTYPEFNGLNTSDPSAVQTAIAQKVNQLYGGGAFNNIPPIARSLASAATAKAASTESAKTDGGAQEEPQRATLRSFAAVPESQNGGANPELAQAPLSVEPSADVWEWTVRIRVKKYEVGCSFAVPIFLGSVPENSAEWLTCDNFVGAHHAFVNSSPDRCGNCRTQQNITLEGFVHLNEAIVKMSGLNSLEPSAVEPYLTRELHWRAIKNSGEVIELSQLSSLEVTVIVTRLGLPPGSMFPVPEETRHCHGVTEGRPAGARSSDA